MDGKIRDSAKKNRTAVKNFKVWVRKTRLWKRSKRLLDYEIWWKVLKSHTFSVIIFQPYMNLQKFYLQVTKKYISYNKLSKLSHCKWIVLCITWDGIIFSWKEHVVNWILLSENNTMNMWFLKSDWCLENITLTTNY